MDLHKASVHGDVNELVHNDDESIAQLHGTFRHLGQVGDHSVVIHHIDHILLILLLVEVGIAAFLNK